MAENRTDWLWRDPSGRDSRRHPEPVLTTRSTPFDNISRPLAVPRSQDTFISVSVTEASDLKDALEDLAEKVGKAKISIKLIRQRENASQPSSNES